MTLKEAVVVVEGVVVDEEVASAKAVAGDDT